MVSTSFCFLFEDTKDSDKLITASKKSFKVDYCQKGLFSTVLMNDDSTYIIKISKNKLNFIINDYDGTIEQKIMQVKNFIKYNFINQIIGFRHCGGEIKIDYNEFSKLESIQVINL